MTDAIQNNKKITLEPIENAEQLSTKDKLLKRYLILLFIRA